jgi:hypothetical protein
MISKDNLVQLSKCDLKGSVLFKSMDNFTLLYFKKYQNSFTYNENGELIKKISTHSSFEQTIWIQEYGKIKILGIKMKGNLIFQFFYDSSIYKNKRNNVFDNKISQTTIIEETDIMKQSISLINRFIKRKHNIF